MLRGSLRSSGYRLKDAVSYLFAIPICTQLTFSVVPLRDVTYDPAHPYQDVNNTGKPRSMEINEAFLNRVNHAGNNVYLASKRRSEMLAASRFYFERAIDGYMRSLQDLSIENIEAIFVTSVLCSFHACFVLSESDEDSTPPSVDPVQWMRIGKGTRFIRHRWADLVGSVWLGTSGVLNGKPGIMMDDPTLFNTEHGRPFLKLLTYAQDFETIHAEDRAIYKDVLCYIGAIYTMIVEHTEDEVAMCRRIVGTASWNDPSFTDFVEARQPRALAILAHLFACMKLIAEKVPWFDGIAERQIPKIYDQLPAGWRPMLAWPIAIMNGEIDREPTETQIDDILAL